MPLRLRLSRPYSTSPPPPPPSSSQSSSPSRIQRLQSRLPRPLRPYLNPLLAAPASHITSFLVLHELTALAPLAGLFALFHYTTNPSVQQWRERLEGSQAFTEGVRKWGRYLARKGWVSADSPTESVLLAESASGEGERIGDVGIVRAEEGRDGDGDGTATATAPRIVVELAAAWAVTKVLLPARIVASVWATPWFARVAVLPITRVFRRLVRR
ncbi:hypothetical protein ANO11243_019290 [Dothideomycetidae sp. 11243]|nr:hypothetical protein ANO11243_019290 [fungal sp. No.11243]